MRRLTPHPSHTPAAPRITPGRLTPLLDALVRRRTLTRDEALTAQDTARRLGTPVETVLYSENGLPHRTLTAIQAALTGSQLIDPTRAPPDVRLIARMGPVQALKQRVVPWRQIGAFTVVLAASPDDFNRARPGLEQLFGAVRMALTTPDQLTRSLTTGFGQHLIHRAETRVPAAESCRGWHAPSALFAGLLVLLALLLAAIWAPTLLMAVLICVTVVLLAATTALKLAAAIASRGSVRQKTLPHDVTLARLPVITLLIPLFREREIADHLLTRLMAIDYPRALLDVCLVLEEGDDTTRAALGRARLLTWMRTVSVPDGTIKTKPRALNYALDFARGSIVGVYDAEDAPAFDQLRRVAHHFANADQNVACVQGMLDYYNSRTNWLTRCFTIEYASWFRVVLPGLARLGLVVPLGGTTLFFRRHLLEQLGGWDAHNVTEDADLGIRLARHGYRTEFVGSVTEEEANGRFWPWVKQRSRWLKGYAITYGVHMRNPRQTLRDLGAWRFFGLNLLFAGTLTQFLLSPVLWSFWLIPLGVPHPVADAMPVWMFWTTVVLFVSTEVVNLTIAGIGLRRAGKTGLFWWAPTLQLYFPLGTIAVYKGLLELAWKPFYWDKTAHGILLPAATTPPPPPFGHQASDG